MSFTDHGLCAIPQQKELELFKAMVDSRAGGEKAWNELGTAQKGDGARWMGTGANMKAFPVAKAGTIWAVK